MMIKNTLTLYHVKCDAVDGTCDNQTGSAPSDVLARKSAAAAGFMRDTRNDLFYCENHCKSAAANGAVLTLP